MSLSPIHLFVHLEKQKYTIRRKFKIISKTKSKKLSMEHFRQNFGKSKLYESIIGEQNIIKGKVREPHKI